MEFDDLLTLLRQSGTSIEVPATDQYECTVLFLWSRKKKSPGDKNSGNETKGGDESKGAVSSGAD